MEQKQMRITPEEMEVIRRVYGGTGGEHTLKVLRKIFLPEFDPNAPLGQNVDLWMTLDVKMMPPEQAWHHIVARNTVITHIEQQLIQLSLLANSKEDSPEEKSAKEKANDTH